MFTPNPVFGFRDSGLGHTRIGTRGLDISTANVDAFVPTPLGVLGVIASGTASPECGLVSGFEIRFSGFRFRFSVVGFRFSGSIFGLQFSDSVSFRFRVSGSGFRVLDFRIKKSAGGWCQFSGFGFRVSDFGCRV